MSGAVDLAFDRNRTRAAFTISHPKGNIITAGMIERLRQGFDELSGLPHLKLITIEGAGPDFSFGASIPEHTPGAIGNVLPAMRDLIEAMMQAPAVTAAVVRGRCLGGGFELALACDLVFASEDATFGLPEIALGVFPPAAAVLLPLRATGAVATRTLLTGESRDAFTWQRAGIVEAVAPASALASVVEEWFAAHLAARSAAALRHAAAAARFTLLAEVRRTLPQLERIYLGSLMRTHDAVEGVAAFLEKRPPRWKDE